MSEDRLIRTSHLARNFASTAILVCAVLAVVATSWAVRSDELVAGAVFAAIPILYAVGCWRMALHPRIVVRDREIEVRNPLRTTTIPLSSVVACTPGYSGISIAHGDGDSVVAYAVQRSNASKWLSRRTRADEIAEYLERRAQALQQQPPGI